MGRSVYLVRYGTPRGVRNGTKLMQNGTLAVGPGYFIWSVFYQLLALCYISQTRFNLAEEAIKPLVERVMKTVNLTNQVPTFAEFELIEIYSRSLRKQRKYDGGLNYLNRIPELTTSEHAPPARALGELSLALMRLDLDCTAKKPSSDEVNFWIEQSKAKFKQAEVAYRLEWTRGTWVFKFFDAMIMDLEAIYSSRSIQSRTGDEEELLEMERTSLLFDTDETNAVDVDDDAPQKVVAVKRKEANVAESKEQQGLSEVAQVGEIARLPRRRRHALSSNRSLSSNWSNNLDNGKISLKTATPGIENTEASQWVNHQRYVLSWPKDYRASELVGP
ncbi:hypothetical protein F4778DRAFT_777658 [Xylariomycetidae sp. FL2044]|nr:hypothetical protein F4778DRAFT_777658 [Xylariomycetidae sp. FL2044]